MDLIIASNNKNKVREIKEILDNEFDNFYSLKDIGLDIDIEETGETFFENSLIKAKTIADITGKVCIADDSGLMVDVLGGKPGVYSARFAGEPCNDENNNKKLLELLKGYSYEEKTAKFVSCIVLYFPNGEYITSTGEVKGHILTEYHGNGGFGYDPLFFADELGKTFGEATSEEKNKISHRARALEDLKSKV